jgi:hypothetical protein
MDSNVILPDLPTYVGQPSLAGLLSVALTVLLPIIAALFMRAHWSTFVKGLVLLGFAAVKAVLEAWLVAANSHVHFDGGPVAYSVGVQFVIAVAAYFGVLRDTTVQRAALARGVIPSKVIDGTAIRSRPAGGRV